MKALFLCLCILLLSISAAPAFAQQEKKDEKLQKNVNAALMEARTASAEQRFQDSETLMLQVTQNNPKLVLPWIELGKAQLGLKKYAEAEKSFKIALGVKPATENAAPQPPAASAPDKTSDLVEQYIRSLPQPVGSSSGLPPLGGGSGGVPPLGGAASSPASVGESANSLPSVGGSSHNGQTLPPQILGPIYASLGEVYAHEGNVAEAQAAFDEAVKEFPAEAADYRSNETIVFFQVGQGDAELDAVKQAIALDPERSSLYYFEGQALLGKSTLDPKTQRLILLPECVAAFKKYLKIAPNGRLATDVRGILKSAGVDPNK